MSAIEACGDFGTPKRQSGSNGDEILFRCPLCHAEGSDTKGRMLRVARRMDGGDLPYVGCRNHDTTEGWRRIVKALRDAGVPGRLLSPRSGQTGHAEEGSPGAGSGTGSGADGSVDAGREQRGGFPDRPDGLGEDDPIPDDEISAWEDALWTPKGRKYRAYLNRRGLTDETIRACRLGLGSFRWRPGARRAIRIVVPIFDPDGICVNARLIGTGKSVKRMPIPHPELTKTTDDGIVKFLTYGAPTRLYGIDELATNTELGGENAKAVVFVFAGEFDRILGKQAGLLALTTTNGEKGLPRSKDGAYLEGRDVVVCYDCDEAGRNGARKFARAAVRVGAGRVRVVDLDPDRADGYDFADLANEGARDDPAGWLAKFLALVDETPDFEDDGSGPGGDSAPPWELSDLGVAEQVLYRDGYGLRYVQESGTWIAWDEERGLWLKYPRNDWIAASNAITGYVREQRALLRGAEEESAEEEYRKFLKQYVNAGKVSAVVRMMADMWQARTSIAEIDARPELLNTANGTLNLETFELFDPAPEDLLTKRTRGAVLEEGSATEGEQIWAGVLERSVPDEGTRDALQRMCGVSLLDGNPLQLMVFLLGPTGTGKSVFSELLLYALGDYAGPFNLSMFRDNQDEKPRADLVRALTQRVIFASEASEQWRLHVDQVKRLTGEDTITARLPHSGEYVDRMPAFTPWFRTNQAPHIESPDLALYRRLLVFPFDHPYTSGAGGRGRGNGKGRGNGSFVARNKALLADAALTWAVEGLMAWREEGSGDIERSGEMVRAEMRFREALNDTQMFLAEETEPDGAGRAAFKDVYERYEIWCSEAGILERDKLSKKALGDRLTALGFRSAKSNSVTYRRGIVLKSRSRNLQ